MLYVALCRTLQISELFVFVLCVALKKISSKIPPFCLVLSNKKAFFFNVSCVYDHFRECFDILESKGK